MADTRNQEKAEATEVLSELEGTDAESQEFYTVSIAPTHPHPWAAGSPVRQRAPSPPSSTRSRNAIRG